MHDFSHEMTTGRIVFGAGALDRVAEEVARLGAHRVLLICGPHEKRWADRIADGLGERVTGRIEDAVQHVPAEVAAAAADTADDLGVDLLLSVGGGSSTGLAKAVARDRGLPILAVPTTYSGSEMSDIWGVTEGQRKTVGRDPRVRPHTVVYDPETTFSMPGALTATSGMNALAHAVEALYAPDLSPVVALLAEEAVRLLARALPVCVERPADLESRSEALYGSCLSGIALGNAVMGIHHKVCHVLGGAYGLPHGGVHSAVLPHATGFNRHAASGAMRRIAAALGTADAPVGLWELAQRIGAPSNLVSLGFDPTAIGAVAATIAGSPPRNPRPVTERGVRDLLEVACTGAPPVVGR